ncbi:hypothetical protein AB0F11_30245 [Streptomyces sp. NPDC032472]|uniref:hypothetical protein n=1 Tax=Streptomyces sp. NPDC032472 TaxID=3155018 RepID=UPI0033EE7ACC
MIRPEVAEFIALGKLPSEDDNGPDEAADAAIDHAADLLGCIARPVTDEEAHALAEASARTSASVWAGLSCISLRRLRTRVKTSLKSRDDGAPV